MRRILIMLIIVLSVLIIRGSWQLLLRNRSKLVEVKDVATPVPTFPSEPEANIFAELTPMDTPPPTVFLAEHAIVYQITPRKREYDPEQEAIDLRFERLYERERRLEIPVKRGTPLMLELPDDQ